MKNSLHLQHLFFCELLDCLQFMVLTESKKLLFFILYFYDFKNVLDGQNLPLRS